MRIIYLIISLSLLCGCAHGATYYVATDGSGDYTTIAQANAVAISGDTISLKCGQSWRESVTPINGVTYSYYGTGNKPKILGSTQATTWTDTGSNIWKTDLTFSADVGNLIFNNEESCGDKQSALDALTEQGEFFYNTSDSKVYLYSTSNPVTYYSVIECAVKQTVFSIANKSNVTIDGLDFRYSGSGTIFGNDSNGITVKNCNFSYNGGSYLTGTTRAGGGIGTWNNATNWLCENCIFYQEFDDGMTNQGNTTATLSNIVWKNNLVVDCGIYGYEIFGINGSISGFHFENNTILNTGACWSINKPTRNYTANIGLYSISATISDFVIKNNIFYSSATYTETSPSYISRCLFIGGGGVNVDNLDNIEFDYNCYYRADDTKEMIYIEGRTYTRAQFASYQSTEGMDTHSISSDPLLKYDYKLQSTSSCIDTGVNLTDVTSDYEGNPRPLGASTDMGAYEYYKAKIRNATLKNCTI